MPVKKFMRTLDGFVRDGKVSYLGTSTLEPDAWKVVKANEFADKRGYEPFKVAQPQYNAANRKMERNCLDMCADYDIDIVPWSPLAGGSLTDKYTHGERPPTDSRAADGQRFADLYLTPANFDALGQVEGVAEAVGVSPAQVSLAWSMHHPQATAPIVGARMADRLGGNAIAAGIGLTSDQSERISTAKCHLSVQQLRKRPRTVGCRCRRQVSACTIDDVSDTDTYVSKFRAKCERKDDFFRSYLWSPIPPEERDDFDSLDYFDPDSNYHVIASVETHADLEPVTVDTSTDGKVRCLRVATFHLELRDTDPTLGVYYQGRDDSPMLSVPFRDKTTGQQTYNDGRYMELTPDMPLDELEEVIVDFNPAYNPFCAFTETFECSFPSEGN